MKDRGTKNVPFLKHKLEPSTSSHFTKTNSNKYGSPSSFLLLSLLFCIILWGTQKFCYSSTKAVSGKN